ncbi:adenylate kinase [Sarcoptes scabiei]|nr:adenylate kinase [Sarcoptes scabiei]
MKRRNVESSIGKLRRAAKRSKVNNDGSSPFSVFVNFKFLLVWILVIILDFISEFRFELLYPFWAFFSHINDSLKFRGFSYVFFYILITLIIDMLCYHFIPSDWLFFVSSTYIWFQFIWYSERGLSLFSILVWISSIYMEAFIRLKQFKLSSLQFEICRPFAAHGIGYPVLSLSNSLKTYVLFRLSQQKKRIVTKENEFLYSLLQKALYHPAPMIVNNHTKQKIANDNHCATGWTSILDCHSMVSSLFNHSQDSRNLDNSNSGSIEENDILLLSSSLSSLSSSTLRNSSLSPASASSISFAQSNKNVGNNASTLNITSLNNQIDNRNPPNITTNSSISAKAIVSYKNINADCKNLSGNDSRIDEIRTNSNFFTNLASFRNKIKLFFHRLEVKNNSSKKQSKFLKLLRIFYQPIYFFLILPKVLALQCLKFFKNISPKQKRFFRSKGVPSNILTESETQMSTPIKGQVILQTNTEGSSKDSTEHFKNDLKSSSLESLDSSHQNGISHWKMNHSQQNSSKNNTEIMNLNEQKNYTISDCQLSHSSSSTSSSSSSLKISDNDDEVIQDINYENSLPNGSINKKVPMGNVKETLVALKNKFELNNHINHCDFSNAINQTGDDLTKTSSLDDLDTVSAQKIHSENHAKSKNQISRNKNKSNKNQKANMIEVLKDKENLIWKVESDNKKLKSDLQAIRQCECDLRKQLEAFQVDEKTMKNSIKNYQAEIENLQKKIQNYSNSKQQDRQTIQKLEKQLDQEKKKSKTSSDLQAQSERKARMAEEAAARVSAQAAINRNFCSSQNCRIKQKEYQKELAAIRKEFQAKDEQIKMKEMMLNEYTEIKNKGNALMQTLAILHEKNSQLEESLKVEKIVKMELYLALEEAKVQINKQRIISMDLEKEVRELKLKLFRNSSQLSLITPGSGINLNGFDPVASPTLSSNDIDLVNRCFSSCSPKNVTTPSSLQTSNGTPPLIGANTGLGHSLMFDAATRSFTEQLQSSHLTNSCINNGTNLSADNNNQKHDNNHLSSNNDFLISSMMQDFAAPSSSLDHCLNHWTSLSSFTTNTTTLTSSSPMTTSISNTSGFLTSISKNGLLSPRLSPESNFEDLIKENGNFLQ